MGETTVMKTDDKIIVRTGPKNRRITITGDSAVVHFNGTTYDIAVDRNEETIAEIPLANKEKIQYVGFSQDEDDREEIQKFLDKQMNRLYLRV